MSGILEVATLKVYPGQEAAYEAAFREASPIIAGMKGYRRHELRRCLEKPGQYLLLVEWDTLEDHTVGFRTSAAYQDWPAWRGSMAQLSINLASILIAGTAVLASQRALYERRKKRHEREELQRAQRRPDVDLGPNLVDDRVGAV